VSRESGELTIIDLNKLEVVGRVNTGGVGNHMAELTADFSQVFVNSPETNAPAHPEGPRHLARVLDVGRRQRERKLAGLR
jgi:hypothetical protein